MDEAGRELYVIGTPPDLAEQVCQAFLCQEFWYKGELADPTNIIWFRVNDQWHRLYFEWDTVFWRISEEAPASANLQEYGEFKLSNLGQGLGVENATFRNYIYGLSLTA